MLRLFALVILVICSLLPSRAVLQAQSIVAPTQNPVAGSRVFGSKGCSNCHAVNGVGGKIGPDLARISQNRSFNDLAAAMWNHLPQMVKEAKKRAIPFPALSAPEAGDLIAFLFMQNYFNVSGNVPSGKKLFTDKNCILCHQIGGVGGVLGPSLDAVAQSGAPIDVAAAMWNHGPAMSEAMAGRGINRPPLSAAELRDLVAYLKSVGPKDTPAQISVIPGRENEGRTLFKEKQCIKCHSILGTGGNAGPDLAKRGLHRDVVEFAAAIWNKEPAMLRAMKVRKVTVPALTSAEMADIVAYLRAFQYFGGPGNPARGRQLLADKQCVKCHSSMPDLAHKKGLDSPAAVMAALWNHGVDMVARFEEGKIPWPQLSADEISHLMAFFEQTARSER